LSRIQPDVAPEKQSPDRLARLLDSRLPNGRNDMSYDFAIHVVHE
jgi:hypothetical protein